MMSDPDVPSGYGLVIRPSLKNVRWKVRGAGAAFLASPALGFAVFGFVKAGRRDGTEVVWATAAGVAAVLGLVVCSIVLGEWLVHRNATVFLDRQHIGRTDIWGRRRAWPLSQVARVELGSRTVRGTQSAQAITRFVGEQGDALFQIPGKEFALGDIRRVCERAGLPLVGAWPD